MSDVGRYYAMSPSELSWLANSMRHEAMAAMRNAKRCRRGRGPSVERANAALADIYDELATTWKRELKLVMEAKKAPR